MAQLQKVGNIKIAYILVSDYFLLEEIEQALIKWFAPRLNFSAVTGSNKKRVVFYVEEEVKEKLSLLAEKENRSLSNWLENLALNTIDSHENQKPEAKNRSAKINFNQPISA
ncbi:MAG: hypothetical protein QNJ72_14960 [Pleurocapsa sp. MO_226.B13]|nr:hypothetical protein [Pleurocapsa sp. MO_226.B13]